MLSDWIRTKAEVHGDRVAARLLDRDVRTYAELDQNADRLALGYSALGLKPGDHVARLMGNNFEGVDSWFGMLRSGIVEVPINTGNVGMSLEYVVDNCDAKAIVVDEEYLSRLEPIAANLTTLEHVIVNRSSTGDLGVELPSRFGIHDLKDLYLDGDFAAPALDERSVASIVYTSGTTGPSKGVVITHSFTHRVTTWTVEVMKYGRDDVILTFFPLFHLMARNCGLLAAIESDAQIVLGDRFSARSFWETCRNYDVTAITYLGDMCRVLMNQQPREDDASNPVTRAFGAGMSVDLWEGFEQRFGVQLTEIYGMSELGGALQSTSTDRRIGSVGKPASHFEVRVHDEFDRPVEVGTPGELVVRPKLPGVMIGEYYNMPKETVEAFRNLWFHSGDRVYQDEDGYFYYVDRTKDMIRRKGENISSYEVERVICSHPAVAEAAAYSINVDGFEEVMVSFVLAEGTAAPPLSELIDLAEGNLPKFAVPRYLRVVDTIPRNASQRALKFQLREQGITDDTHDMRTAAVTV